MTLNKLNIMAKHILGLDLGANSIGWALVEIDHENGIIRILGLGSRILPMDAGEIKDFESSGKIKSAAAQRREKRGPRRLNERYILRRDRLHLVLDLLSALPEHYKLEIDFSNEKGEKCGQFKKNKEPKLAHFPKLKGRKAEFLFKDSYQEMLNELGIENKKKNRIPYDWTLYYLRRKALKSEISLEELAWVLLSYNQKRGYEKTEVENKSNKEGEIVEELDLQVKNVTKLLDKEEKIFFRIELDGIDNFAYNEYSNVQMTFENDLKEVKVISKVDETGTVTGKEFTVIDIFPLRIENVKYEKQDGKHKYTLIYNNGWEEVKQPKNYTFRYENAKTREYEYIVETIYDEKGNIKLSQGKPRKLREPDFGDNSNDWTLLKKKTEKEALAFNVEQGYINLTTKEPKKYISTKIYDILKQDAKNGNRTKIIGGMFQVVDRDFYREELNQIIETQKQFHNSLKDKTIFEQCVKTLYPKNEAHAKSLLMNKNTIQHLLVEDILLFQRPLKSKKSEIADCKYEIQRWIDVVDKKTGEIFEKKQAIYHKAVSASHPYFQEFRIWDKLHNLRLIQIEKEVNGKLNTNVDVTDDYFSAETYQQLFELLNNQKTLSQHKFIDFFKSQFKDKKEDFKNFVWNFPEEEEFNGNETRISFAIRFKRCGFTDYTVFLTQEKEIALWHYLYSVSYKERTEDENKSLKSFFSKFLEGSVVSDEIMDKLVKDFANYPKFPSKYCAYSEKALKKLLPFIRMGENNFKGQFEIAEFEQDLKNINYNKANIPSYLGITKENLTLLNEEERRNLELKRQKLYEALWKYSINTRIDEILQRLSTIDFTDEGIDFSTVIDNDTSDGKLPFPKGLFNTFKSFGKPEDYTNLNLTQASYLVYGRHSELAQAKYWTSPKQIRDELHQELKQHSLNNPVAEKIILEMMQIVADIWDYYGQGKEKFFSKIHIEVGRELKKSAKEKESITKNQNANKYQNKRLRQLLEDFLTDSPYNAIPQNTDHFERLKIVEEGAEHIKNTDKQFFSGKPYTKKDIEDILKKPKITQADFEKYKLWIEQGYKSPYTNRPIKLTDLFNGGKYNIDHVFPQASVTNDSLSNKVVCEREINKEKSNQTGREFVNNPTQRRIYCSAHNSEVEIVDDDTYVSIVKSQFSGTKRFILLSREIPKGFTSSQLNNTRHIARKAMELLSHIVREPGEVEFRSKNVLPVTGAVTSALKKTWRLDEVWKELVAPRFIRMNKLTESSLFGQWQISKSGQKYFDCNLDDTIREKDESYDIKRIDHRHHALDALIVALCTEEHVNYINNINTNAKSDDYGKQKQIEKYRKTLKKKIKFSQSQKENPKEKDWFFMLPGEVRRKDAENSSIDTVLRKSYFYKESGFEKDYRKMILTSLQHTITTFKQNLRVINKTVNTYKNSPTSFARQNTDNRQKQNWSIRRSLGKGTLYGKIDIGERANKQLLKNIDYFYENIDAIIDVNLKAKLEEIKNESSSLKDFETALKNTFKNITVECVDFKAASRYNSNLDISFNSEKIKTVTDTGIRKILRNHLLQFDTVELLFEEALKYYDSVLEKKEIEAIIADVETSFQSFKDFELFLKQNNYKYGKDKADYSKLNVFISQIFDRDFRNEEQFKDKIIEHPEIAFTFEKIEEMNLPDNLLKLNGGKNHKPILKTRTYTGFGNEKRVSENKLSNKSKQFVKVDKGTNFYISIYELENKSNESGKNPIRIFREINLFDLIDFQKAENSFELPVEKHIFNEDGEKYNFLFTLTQNDIVKINSDSSELIYAFNRFTGSEIYFRPINHASEISKCEVDLKFNVKAGKLGGSQTNETTSINGEQIKNICWKQSIDRLGNFKFI